jgi:hypothetical protein
MAPMPLENGRKPRGAEVPDAAHYISSITDELARLAKSHDFDALAYILDMARLEADESCKHQNRQMDNAAGGPG